MRIDVAVGEVHWERGLLAEIAINPDVDLGRRIVDLTAKAEPGELLIACPSVRGFDETVVRRWADAGRVLVLLDSVRPPWLDDSGLDVRDVQQVAFRDLIAECALLSPTPRLHLVQNPDRGVITAFVGVSGGVGVSTLAWLYANSRRDALLIDCNSAHPSLALLAGRDSDDATLLSSVRELRRTGTVDVRGHATTQARSAHVLTLPLVGEPTTQELSDVTSLLVPAAEQFSDVVLDGGAIGSHASDLLLEHVDRLVLIAAATPLGMVRLCSTAGKWTRFGNRQHVVVNRVRETVAGSMHVADAIRRLVETELGITPFLVADQVGACDLGWLAGDWREMEQAGAALQFVA